MDFFLCCAVLTVVFYSFLSLHKAYSVKTEENEANFFRAARIIGTQLKSENFFFSVLIFQK